METSLVVSSDKKQFEQFVNEKMKDIAEQKFQVMDVKYQMIEVDLRVRYSAFIIFAHRKEIKDMVRTTKY